MRGRHDSGSATVFVLAAMGVICLAAAVVCCVGAAITVRHRAAAAADAAALAAAARAVDGPAFACSRAADLASDDGARLTECVLDGSIARVAVSVRPPGWLAFFGPAIVKATAGPAETTESGPAETTGTGPAVTKEKNVGHPLASS